MTRTPITTSWTSRTPSSTSWISRTPSSTSWDRPRFVATGALLDVDGNSIFSADGDEIRAISPGGDLLPIITTDWT